MPAEATLWAALQRRLGGAHATRIESGTSPGLPKSMVARGSPCPLYFSKALSRASPRRPDMKTSILALAIALAFSFTPTPAAGGLSNQTKCDSGKLLAAAKFSQCRIKVDFLALKKGAKLSA